MQNEAIMEAMITIERKIFIVRGMEVRLDSDRAERYGVKTIRLDEQVRCNAARFPEDFMFQLTEEEMASLSCQTGTSEKGAILKPHIAISN